MADTGNTGDYHHAPQFRYQHLWIQKTEKNARSVLDLSNMKLFLFLSLSLCIAFAAKQKDQAVSDCHSVLTQDARPGRFVPNRKYSRDDSSLRVSPAL